MTVNWIQTPHTRASDLEVSHDGIPPGKEAIYAQEPVLSARNLVITFGRVVGLDGVDLDLYPGEVLAVIGDNGAGKSTLIKCLTGAYVPNSGTITMNGREVSFKKPQDAREAGIETVYQQLAVIPALDIASNLYLAREDRRKGPLGSIFRMLDKKGMERRAGEAVQNLGIQTIQNMGQAVETLSGGQRQAVAVARAAAFGSKVVVLDEPTAALGVKESGMVLDMIKQLRDKGLSIILVSHNMPHVWEVADRIHIQRLGGRAGVITPESHDMGEGVAIMTGAKKLGGTATPAAEAPRADAVHEGSRGSEGTRAGHVEDAPADRGDRP
ncbi:monosaccharide ABC transporter ATP-binding protein (CUT2 family) [Knoellia remsis]|uniref:Monosaccharide ABC transporter ATP-binding protein (CUT2 family) n=1 Tax=Knoellia remsis TaxID=407159 RepID=A0A2T0TX34_9MICO|nr:ATP-binding cassette domain-containing protein [Knoellia remsis]PRY50266.1 monosaccharide ABC transporter ATP-binding protein (CUT2 family) [Knoellia remsis]